MLLSTCVATISRAQRMARDVGAELLAQQRREVARQRGADPGVLRQVGGHDLVEQPHLAVGERSPPARGGEAGAARLALGDLVFGRQELDGTVQVPGLLEEADEARLLVEVARSRGARRPTAPASGSSCRAAPARRRRRSSARAARLRCFSVISPSLIARPSRILMLTSWSEVSTPAELSIASVLMAHAGERRLDAPALGEAEVAAFGRRPCSAARGR